MTLPLNHPHDPIRGRGAAGNPPNRFEALRHTLDESVMDDGWEVAAPGRPPTQYFRDHSRSIIATNDSPDVGFDASINPYRGCEHGCIYCYARPYHEFLGLSAGLDFESKIFVKEDAPELLRAELLSPQWRPQPLGICGITDAYQPVERRLRLTRRCLEVLLDFRNPALIITKNHLLTRDIDLFQEMAALRLVSTCVSITTLDASLQQAMEPRTASPEARLRAVRELAAAGVPVGVNVSPIIPGLNDHEMPRIMEAAREAGAQDAGYTVVRLPHAVAPLFKRWLADHFPERREMVLNKIRSVRHGKLAHGDFKDRMTGEGPVADQIKATFLAFRKRLAFPGRPVLTTEHFRRVIPPGGQLEMF